MNPINNVYWVLARGYLVANLYIYIYIYIYLFICTRFSDLSGEISNLESYYFLEAYKYISLSKCSTHGYHTLTTNCILKPPKSSSCWCSKSLRTNLENHEKYKFAIRCPWASTEVQKRTRWRDRVSYGRTTSQDRWSKVGLEIVYLSISSTSTSTRASTRGTGTSTVYYLLLLCYFVVTKFCYVVTTFYYLFNPIHLDPLFPGVPGGPPGFPGSPGILS